MAGAGRSGVRPLVRVGAVLVLEEVLPLLQAVGVLLARGGVQPVCAGPYVGDEPLRLAVGLGGDDGAAHGGVGVQRVLDLAEFDAEAADLHLVVDAADELQGAVGQSAHQVAGAVQAGAGFRGEGVGDEPLLSSARGCRGSRRRRPRRPRTVLADDAWRHGPRCASRTWAVDWADGPADGDDRVSGTSRGLTAGGGDAVLGRSVGVDDGQAGWAAYRRRTSWRRRPPADAEVRQRQPPLLRRGLGECGLKAAGQGHHRDAGASARSRRARRRP